MAVFSTRPYDREFLTQANEDAAHDLVFFEVSLRPETAGIAEGFPAVCAFVNDDLGADVLRTLHEHGTRLIALRSAGFNHVDVPAAGGLDLTVTRVPAYSPYSVAEHAVGLILALNRRVHRAYARVRDANFSLTGLLGFDLHGRTVGVVGTGAIGTVFARIMSGFGCRILAHDPYERSELVDLGVEYVALPELFTDADIISLHCPLTPQTHHLVDAEALELMGDGAMLINTSRGALVDTVAVIAALKAGKLGYLGLDVYEEEADLFFEDLSDHVIHDDVFMRLLTFPNVIVTAHQAFFTSDALNHIAETTIANITRYERGAPAENVVAAGGIELA